MPREIQRTLPVRTDEIRLAQAPARKDRAHSGAVVVHMDPIAHLAAIAVQLRTAPSIMPVI